MFKTLKIFTFLLLFFSLNNIANENLISVSNIDCLNNKNQTEEIEDTEFNIYFSGDGANEDSAFIDFGDIEILIDVGEYQLITDDIVKWIESYVQDNTIEYLIFTHGHSDHIGNFNTVFQYITSTAVNIKVGTIIDWECENNLGVFNSSDGGYKRYLDNRNWLANEDGSKYEYMDYYFEENTPYKFELQNNNDIANMYLLYNKYIFESSDMNQVSVCLLFEYNGYKYLTNGDLFSAGERSLLTYNNIPVVNSLGIKEKLLENVTFYKASHHGSKTSNCETFLDVIKPKYIYIPCYANFPKDYYDNIDGIGYSFPKQEALNSMLKYTKNIYMPKWYDPEVEGENKKVVFNGDVTFQIKDIPNVVLENDTDFLSSKYVEIDNTYTDISPYDIPLQVYNFSGYESESENYFGKCTLLKYRDTDILINCGSPTTYNNSYYFFDKLKTRITGNIEYLLVTSPSITSMSQLVGNNERALLNYFEVENLIDFGDVPRPDEYNSNSIYSAYLNFKNGFIQSGKNYYSCTEDIDQNGQLKLKLDNFYIDILSLTVMNHSGYGKSKDNSMAFTIEYGDKHLLFIDGLSEKIEQELVENYNYLINENVIYYLSSHFGYTGYNSDCLLNSISNSDLYIAINSIGGKNYNGFKLIDKGLCDDFINCSPFNNVYLTTYFNNGKYYEENGDLSFSFNLNQEGIYERRYTEVYSSVNEDAIKLGDGVYYDCIDEQN